MNKVGEVFIHSKVLVVDDKIAVIESTNVNDRSFVGHSDSEIGAFLTDDDPNPGKVGCVKDFRLRLWRQYLGLSPSGEADMTMRMSRRMKIVLVSSQLHEFYGKFSQIE